MNWLAVHADGSRKLWSSRVNSKQLKNGEQFRKPDLSNPPSGGQGGEGAPLSNL